MEKVIGAGVIVAIGVALGIVCAICLALPVMWLWNFVVPDVFGYTEITFEQALAMMVLSSLLLKSHSFDSSSKK